MALAAYRHLLRSARLAFRGDERTYTAAVAQMREGFRSLSSADPESPEVAKALHHARDVATILRQNVVQGVKEGDRFKLRIHEETERGDNDTVKGPGGTTVKIDGKPCSER